MSGILETADLFLNGDGSGIGGRDLIRNLADELRGAQAAADHATGLLGIELAERDRLRAAITFWYIARFPELLPKPDDIQGRCQIQAALDMAENTLCHIAKSGCRTPNRAGD